MHVSWRSVAQVFLLLAGICTVAYAAVVAMQFATFGRPPAPRTADPLADRFMPVYQIREEHHVGIDAPADVTMAAAQQMRLDDSPLVRAIFKGREVLLHASSADKRSPQPFITYAQSIGWRILAYVPGREMVFGAVTRPWEPNVVFRGVAPAAFARFREPNYVKILWTLRADPTSASSSVFSTQTRAVATDRQSREQFRRYWAAYSPGIVVIRLAVLPLVKDRAERTQRSKR